MKESKPVKNAITEEKPPEPIQIDPRLRTAYIQIIKQIAEEIFNRSSS